MTEEIIKGLKNLREVYAGMAIQMREDRPGDSYYSFKVAEICGKAAEELKRNIPQKMEMEGGNTTYWNVCPECHGAIDCRDRFCRHCGQAVTDK